MDKVTFSIVVPAYNVMDYIDVCIQSLVAQTYPDFEVILINDGSTDGTEEKCLQWQELDKRIYYVSQENVGLGKTRTKGVELSHGEYILFLDADDWYDERALEVLWNYVKNQPCDITVFDYWPVSDEKEKPVNYVKCPLFLETPTNVKKDASIIYRIEPSMCLKLFRSGFIKTQNIDVYEGKAEDLSVSAAYICAAETVGQVRYPLYYYRKGRNGSITSGKNYLKEIFPAIEVLENNLERVKYVPRKEIALFYRYFLLGTLKTYKDIFLWEKGEYDSLWASAQKLIEKYSENRNITDSKVFIWGSYSLRKMWNSVDFLLDNMVEHITASSIVSAMSEPVSLSVKNKNAYREKAVLLDLQKKWIEQWNRLEDGYLLLDFMEERYGIFGNEYCCATNSDYLWESDNVSQITGIVPGGKILEADTPQFLESFKHACLKWIAVLRQTIPSNRVILVKNFLSEKHGREFDRDNMEVFKDIERIRAINQQLEHIYVFFEKNFRGINVIVPDEKLVFTEEAYSFGVEPYHYNEYLLCDIGEKIKRIIEAAKVI